MSMAKGTNKTDAQRRAENKHQAKTMETLGCKVKRADAEKFREIMQQQGLSVNAALTEYVIKTVNSHPEQIGAEQPR